MKSKIYKIMCVACVATALSSCLDTVILPDDITVGEDLWKKKSDVALMVNSAYQGMTTENVIERLIVWPGARSDEMVQANSPEGAIPNAIAELMAASTQVTNRYASWGDFYSVINRCNIVLEKAAGVLAEDPNYTQGDYLTDRSQMLALRALCYFYLVRNFRDVVYVDKAFLSSSQSRDFVQSSPAVVLQNCIESLKEAADNAIQARSYSQSDWRRVGWFTQDGIYALLADIHLWRASVLHSNDDYQKAVDYCTRVIESKKSQHVPVRNEQTTEYPLAQAQQAYNNLFVRQNAEESIFELQITKNPALCKYYYKYGSNTSTEGYLKASVIFTKGADGTIAKDAIDDKVFSINDIRYYSSIYRATTTGVESFDVRKMISTVGQTNLTQQVRQTDRAYADLDQNFIIYRLSDVMLMKAEAMVQMVDTVMAGLSDEDRAAKKTVVDAQLEEAFNLVKAVNERAFLESNQSDALTWDNVDASRKDKGGMELLVLEERLRELCFEGKRWYDLLRFNYRHVTGVDYNSLMADRGLEALPANYKDMLELVTRSRTQSSGLMAKIRNEAYLYLPIPNSDQVLATQLKQNPAYGSTNQFERN